MLDTHLRDSDKWITCVIPLETLRDRFRAPSGQKKDLLEAFRQNRARIEEIAVGLIESARYELDGTILIRVEDV